MPERFLEYLIHEKRSSPNTVKAYKTDLYELKDFLKTQYGLASITDARTEQLRTWLVERMEAGNSARTINRKLSSLKSFLKWRKKFYGLTNDPSAKLSAPKPGVKLPKFVDADVLSRTNRVPTEEWLTTKPGAAHIVDVLYQTGMRSAELIGLEVADVDFASRSIKVLGKRNKERIIPMGKALDQTLKEYLSIRKEIDPAPEVKNLFVTGKGTPLYPRYLYDLVNQFLAMAGAGNALGPHALRHSFATHMLSRGADINSIKELLGHESLAATQVYTHTDISLLIEVHKNSHPRG